MAIPKADLDGDSKKGTPKVATSAKYRVRLRGTNLALKGSVSGSNSKGLVEERFELPPNRWVAVSEIVYDFLRTKYDKVVEKEVPDWEPGGDNDSPSREPRIEEYQPYIIEFA